MKKIGKIKLNKSDYLVLNGNELSTLKGGERTKIACMLGHKVYQCVNLELNCPNTFTTGDCGQLNTTCSQNFSTTTF